MVSPSAGVVSDLVLGLCLAGLGPAGFGLCLGPFGLGLGLGLGLCLSLVVCLWVI